MATGDQLVQKANEWLAAKVPYKWGGISKLGADCSGFVQSALKELGVNVGRTTYDQIKQGTKIELVGSTKLDSAKPGDILFFGNANAPYHEGVYVGNGEMINLAKPGTLARKEKVWSDLSAIRRFTDNTSSSFTAQTAGLSVPGFGSASDLVSTLSSLKTWVRVGETIFGTLLILVGLGLFAFKSLDI